eukprot:m.398676 g.398676  ORF g.398676 m.398676 type:complete len:69 (-) comp20111_c1_seq1:51-257(-)
MLDCAEGQDADVPRVVLCKDGCDVVYGPGCRSNWWCVVNPLLQTLATRRDRGQSTPNRERQQRKEGRN